MSCLVTTLQKSCDSSCTSILKWDRMSLPTRTNDKNKGYLIGCNFGTKNNFLISDLETRSGDRQDLLISDLETIFKNFSHNSGKNAFAFV